jgi:hypothetical protein
MGDRGNICVQMGEDNDTVYLYTHSAGSNIERILAEALDSRAGRNRWNDESYLTRIIFDHLTGLTGGEMGYGISTYIVDNEHPIPTVDCKNGCVYLENGKTESFEDFIKRVLSEHE